MILTSAVLLLLLEQPGLANAVIIHINLTNSDLDTNKPISLQINSLFQYQKAHLTAEKYRNYTENINRLMENATNACTSPFAMIIPQGIKLCNFYIPFVYVFCQADVVKQSLFECSNPSLSDYIASHGIRNPEANLRYAFENQQRTTGNASDIFSRDKSILFK
jgi:hypothetical protein